MRRGAAADIGLEKFVEALKDSSTGLTYPALTGVRKQSVEDVEKLFGEGVIRFMEQHKYENEAKYLRTVRNWRRAVDERGLSDIQRQQFCSEFLDYILKDLIPWYSVEKKDLSTLEVNRCIHNIIYVYVHYTYANLIVQYLFCRPVNQVRGFTRETLIALAADIETRQWRRAFLLVNGLPPEHPRASTTDDVECFFSILRDTVGKDFKLKQVI